MELTISQLAQQIQARLVGEGSGVINGVNSLESADKKVVAFVSSDKFLAVAKKTNAAAIITAKEIEGLVIPQLVVKNVDAALIKTLGIFAPKLKAKKPGIDSTARISNSAKIGKAVFIGAAVVIEDDVEIGDGTVIDSGCKIGQNTKIGKNCRFDYNVAVYYNCKVGNNVIIQANSTIGSTGFGYALIDNMPQLIPHNGGVIIEDFVEIGANVCIDRAKFDNTVIGAGTKIDNLVQIAHNVKIGKCCFIVAQVGVAGSCKIGNGVILAGQAGIIERINIGDRAIIGAQSGVVKDVEAGKTMVGTPAINARDRIREVFLLERLPGMAKQVEQMSKRLDKLEASKDNSD